MEIGLLNLLDKYLAGDVSSKILYMSLYYIPTIPFFLYLGVMFSGSRLRKNDKFTSGVIIGAIFPTIALMPISYFLYTYENTKYLGILIGIGHPISLVY